ncbi:hypothetical protein V1264_017222 [Littorina saxatilis]|uniref:Phosphatidylinositol-specific phospholipase C X domain-containing protein n=2 Tax=Littorina saxatilis TaxID=31220 RepID=A0AAN9GF61_9CAEN
MGCCSSKRNQADWMNSLGDEMRNRLPLWKLALPGSHDSGTFQLNRCCGIAADCDVKVRIGLDLLSAITCCVSSCFIHKWGQCQALNFYQQLKAGVRYFDMRVEKGTCCGRESYNCVHTLRGASVRKCMEDVKEFLLKHEGEVVLLDFNRFFGMESDEDHINLVAMLEKVFFDRDKDRSMLYRYSPKNSPQDLTLNKLCQDGTRVIVFYYDADHPNKTLRPAERSQLLPGSTIKSQASWANTMCVESWQKKQNNQSDARHNADKFYVCQGVLTPGTKVVLKNACNTLCCCGLKGTIKTECADKINPSLMRWMKDDVQNSETKRGVIFSADFVSEEYCEVDEHVAKSFAQSVIELNQFVKVN